MIIGICGKSGSGKSTLSRTLVKHYKNAIHLDIDKVGYNVLMIDDVKNELIKSYGKEILSDENIDRKKLGEIVFTSCLEMKNLSNITWKYMQIEIDKFLTDNKDKIIILDWLLLSISKYFDKCDVKVLLDIPYEVRKERAIKRDNITEEAYYLREKASIIFDTNKFDYVINNNSSLEIKRLMKLI